MSPHIKLNGSGSRSVLHFTSLHSGQCQYIGKLCGLWEQNIFHCRSRVLHSGQCLKNFECYFRSRFLHSSHWKTSVSFEGQPNNQGKYRIPQLSISIVPVLLVTMLGIFRFGTNMCEHVISTFNFDINICAYDGDLWHI